MKNARSVWLQIHLYLALVLGAFIAVLALSGSILTFHPEVDRLLNPALRVSHHGAPRISADAAVAAVTRKLHLSPALVWMPTNSNPVYVLELFDSERDVYRLVTVNAFDGEILADRIWGSTFITFLFDLHTSLFMGESGLLIVGWLAVALILSIATGIYLWWPRTGPLSQALKPRRVRAPLALNFELHRLTGLYLAPLLLLIAFAGVYFAMPTPLQAVVGVFSELSPDPESQPVLAQPPAGADAPRLPLTEVLKLVQAHEPASRAASITMPDRPEEPYSVRFVDRDEPANRNGRSTLWVDPYSGKVLQSHVYSRLGVGNRLLLLQLPLHSGELFGAPGRVLTCVAGLAVCLLYGTGLFLWWKRRRRKHA